MIKLKLDLRTLAERWRSTGRKTRLASLDITHLMARGHMNGMSDGLDLAADDVDTLLDAADSDVDPEKPP